MLAIVSLDLVAAEACYHGTCCTEYTAKVRNKHHFDFIIYTFG